MATVIKTCITELHYRISFDLALDLGTKGVYHLTLESQRKVQLQMPKNIFFCQKKNLPLVNPSPEENSPV